MTREEHLKFCKICKNQTFDFKQGIICGLTGKQANFDLKCNSFYEDIKLKAEAESKITENELITKTAGQGKRFANFLLDYIFLIVISMIFGAGLGIVIAIISPQSVSFFDADNKLINYFFGFVVGMIYYTFLEFATGRTIAKFITKTKVVTEKGEKPDLGSILVRSLCRFIPFEPFSFLGSDASGWHDKLSKTKVIEV